MRLCLSTICFNLDKTRRQVVKQIFILLFRATMMVRIKSYKKQVIIFKDNIKCLFDSVFELSTYVVMVYDDLNVQYL